MAWLLSYWTLVAVVVVVVAARECDMGALQCASVMGNTVEFCHWDRPRLFEQPEIVCNGCRRAAYGDVLGVACNAVALRNWADSDPIWLQAPLFASREVGLIGHVHYELRRDMFGKVTIVGMMEHTDVTFQRLKHHRDDAMFRSIEIAACFEATITSMSKDGTPIHYTLTGPSKVVELKEPNLWIGAQGFAHLTLRPLQCRLNRGIKEETPRPSSPPPTQAQQVVPVPAHHNDDVHNGPPPDLRPTGPNAESRHGQQIADDSVELVYPDGHIEIVPERYIHQHFVTSQLPGLPPTRPAERDHADPYADHHHHYPHVVERPVISNPVPISNGELPPIQYHAAPEHRVPTTQHAHRTETVIAPVTGDRVVLPMGQGSVQNGGSPVAVIPVIYYVTDPGHVVPANTNGYVVAGF